MLDTGKEDLSTNTQGEVPAGMKRICRRFERWGSVRRPRAHSREFVGFGSRSSSCPAATAAIGVPGWPQPKGALNAAAVLDRVATPAETAADRRSLRHGR